MKSDLLKQLDDYGEHFEADLPDLELDDVRTAERRSRPFQAAEPIHRRRLRPVVVVPATVLVTLVLIGAFGAISLLGNAGPDVADTPPTNAITLPTATAPTTIPTPTTLLPPGIPEPPPATTTPTTMVVVLEESESDAELRSQLEVNGPRPALTNLDVGTIPAPLDGEVILGRIGNDGDPGFDWDDLSGKPTVVLLWDAWPGLPEADRSQGGTSFLNLSAFQETYDLLGDELNMVSVISQEDADIAIAVMAREGHSFPVLATSGSIPWTWPEGFAWVLLDEEGHFLDWFFAWGSARSGTAAWALPVNLLLENLGNVPRVGAPAPDAPTPTG